MKRDSINVDLDFDICDRNQTGHITCFKHDAPKKLDMAVGGPLRHLRKSLFNPQNFLSKVNVIFIGETDKWQRMLKFFRAVTDRSKNVFAASAKCINQTRLMLALCAPSGGDVPLHVREFSGFDQAEVDDLRNELLNQSEVLDHANVVAMQHAVSSDVTGSRPSALCAEGNEDDSPNTVDGVTHLPTVLLVDTHDPLNGSQRQDILTDAITRKTHVDTNSVPSSEEQSSPAPSGSSVAQGGAAAPAPVQPNAAAVAQVAQAAATGAVPNVAPQSLPAGGAAAQPADQAPSAPDVRIRRERDPVNECENLNAVFFAVFPILFPFYKGETAAHQAALVVSRHTNRAVAHMVN